MFDVKDTALFELDENDFDTVMANDIAFTGSIKFAKPFMIKGKMNGSIEATSDLVIDTNAEVNADIVADRVLIKGKVKGNISGKKMIFVTATGSVTGDLTSVQVVLEPGSSFTGKCSMIKNDGGILQ
ncbi:MAG: polymer-forming cytoskeletal protein [Treponema sp.]